MFDDVVTGPAFALIWVVGWIAASIVYRSSRGKPILFFGVDGADFIERFASGHSDDTWYARFGGANNCLVVAVARNRLIVRPIFPFNLLFLPEIYSLEHVIPIERIIEVSRGKRFFKSVVVVRFRDVETQERRLSLYVKKPEVLVGLLERASGS